jgi:hypothetical protein
MPWIFSKKGGNRDEQLMRYLAQNNVFTGFSWGLSERGRRTGDRKFPLGELFRRGGLGAKCTKKGAPVHTI